MPEPATTPQTQAADPLRPSADARAMAVQAAQDGASIGQAKVSEMMSATGGFLSRLTYTTCYVVSYVVVFPTLLVVRAVPKDNAVVHGLVDGARAARAALASRAPGFAPGDSPDTEPHRIILPGGNQAV